MTTLLGTRALSKSFSLKRGLLARAAEKAGLTKPAANTVYAVNGLSLQVARGEVLGLVGESGCGKSTVGRMVAGLLPPTSGSMTFAADVEGDGGSRISTDTSIDTSAVNGGSASIGSRSSAMPQRVHAAGVARHLHTQMVFQNPYASLNPRLRVEQLISEAAVYHGLVARADVSAFVRALLDQVGLDPSYASRFPHQFSGGQRQRIAIARALSLSPQFLVCDEAVSALDVSVQAQILNLFMDLREARGLTYLFISHNLAVVEHIADRVAIMYLGRIVELAETARVFGAPNHPYTRALIADAPRLDAAVVQHRPIQGELPSPLNPPTGCAFHPRCPHAMARCAAELPALREVAPGHWSACHLNDVS